MAHVNNSAVIFENISDEDFTHTYDGVPYTIKAGEQQVLTFPVGNLLAKHLAMRIIRNEAIKKGIVGDKDKLGKPVVIYTDAKVREVMAQIIKETVEKPLPAVKSDGELQREKTAQLQKELGDKVRAAKPEVTKKEIIEELTKREAKFNPRASREELLGILMELEQKGE